MRFRCSAQTVFLRASWSDNLEVDNGVKGYYVMGKVFLDEIRLQNDADYRVIDSEANQVAKSGQAVSSTDCRAADLSV